MYRTEASFIGIVGALCICLTGDPAFAEDRALVVGIDDYSALGVDMELAGAVADANRIRDFLIETQGFSSDEVTVLTNADASSKAIMDAIIDELIGKTQAGDRVFFYFAGLGSRILQAGGGEADGLAEVVLAHDADTFLGKMPEEAFSAMFDIIPDRKVTLVFDTSFQPLENAEFSSGDPVRPRSVDLGAVAMHLGEAKMAPQPAASVVTFEEPPFGSGAVTRFVWNASAPSQLAWEGHSGGLFTSAFIDASSSLVADVNGNGAVTNAEVLNRINQQLREWCSTNPECQAAGLEFIPHFGGDLSGIAVEGERQTLDPHDEMRGFISDLFAPNNGAGLTLKMNANGALAIGDKVEFTVTSSRQGTLVLLDIDPLGRLSQIFPSKLAATGENSIRSGGTLTIPQGLGPNGAELEIRVSEPAGKGLLLALHVEDQMPTLEALLPENLSGGTVDDARLYLSRIAKELLTLQAGENGNTPVRWSAVYLPYEIVEN